MITSRYWPSIRQQVSFGRAPAPDQLSLVFWKDTSSQIWSHLDTHCLYTCTLHISDRLSMTNTLLICLPKNVLRERFKVKFCDIYNMYYKIQCTCYTLCHFNHLKHIFSQHNFMLVYYFRYTDEVLCFNSKNKSRTFQ